MPYDLPFVLLCAAQAGAVLLARPERAPTWAARLHGRVWALVPLGSIVGCIALVDLTPDAARWYSWLALVAVPPFAGLAVWWVTRRGWSVLGPVALFAVALTSQGTTAADASGVVLDLLACAALGALLAAVAPPGLLRIGIILMALADAALVTATLLQPANDTLNAAAPGPGLPQFQRAVLDGWQTGFGDLFLGGVLGGVLLTSRRAPIALVTFVFALAWGLLFLVVDLIPATIPVALALLADEGWTRYARRRDGPGSAYAAASAVTGRVS